MDLHLRFRFAGPPGQMVRMVRAIALLGLVVAPPLMAADPPAATSPASSSAASDGLSGAAFLEKTWPDHPEWLAMVADIIVRGDRMSGSDGWFRKGAAQTRFDWKSTRAALDCDGNELISRTEFTGTDADFARLDRNRDGVLTAPDFGFASPPGGPAPATVLFSRADRDGNGKVTRSELEAFFATTDSDGRGFLALTDLEQAFAQAPPGLRGSPGAPEGPTRWTFLKCFLRQELGPFPAGPATQRDRSRLYVETGQEPRRGHAVEDRGPETRRAGLRKFHVSPVPRRGGGPRKTLPALPKPGHVSDGLRPRGASERRLANGG